MDWYGQRKLADVLFTNKLAQLYSALTSVPLHLCIVQSEKVRQYQQRGRALPASVSRRAP
ncbi:hypothetical protein K431DRAFT_287483 [Polychaeton citri CBS 116435]|uniref:Uncharacterized protein n=1 Tax=Polychaeton citri CBS 116435 TaxID=1314669 RepID=A0A9P4Q2J3_9PEZI|nr:hypothetical protein K431DRAFT_287483 [Polychaeton citri CBS 116435]